MEAIIQLQKKLDKIKNHLPEDQQQLFNLKSIQNFLYSFDKLSSYRNEVLELLEEYFKMMESYDYYIDKDVSKLFIKKYITRIGTYYHKEAGFKVRLSIQEVLIYSIGADLILFITGLIKKPIYSLLVPFIILIYFFYIKIFFENKNKVCGAHY